MKKFVAMLMMLVVMTSVVACGAKKEEDVKAGPDNTQAATTEELKEKRQKVEAAANQEIEDSEPEAEPMEEQIDDEKDNFGGDIEIGDIVSDLTDTEGMFAEYVSDETGVVVTPLANGLTDDTFIGCIPITFGELHESLNSAMKEGRYISKEFLRQLVACEFVDQANIKDASLDALNVALTYCVSIADSFYSEDITIKSLTVSATNPDRRIYEVHVHGAENPDQTWIWDRATEQFFIGENGQTEYVSTMFDTENVLAVWLTMIEMAEQGEL